MRVTVGLVVASVSACLALTSCAGSSLSAAPPFNTGRLLTGAAAPPPAGLLQFCARTPDECGEASLGAMAGSEASTGAARPPAAFRHGSEPTQSGGSLFHALLGNQIAQAPRASEGRTEINLTAERWSALRAINRAVNRAIAPATDQALYGVEEFWTRPLLNSAVRSDVRGDCEDYALEKRARLIAAGWPPEALALAVAFAPGVGLHATLVVQTDRGDFVLDNLAGEPRAMSALNYAWVSRQAGQGMTHWATAHANSAPAIMAGDEQSAFHRLLAERLSARTPTLIAVRPVEPLAPLPDEVSAPLAILRSMSPDAEQKAPPSASRSKPRGYAAKI